MADTVDPVATIRAATDGAMRAPVDWTEVAVAVTKVSESGSQFPGAEDALVALLRPENTIRVTARQIPHIQSPQDMLRAAAIDALVKLTKTKYLSLFDEVAAGQVSPIIKRSVALLHAKVPALAEHSEEPAR